MAMAVVLAGCSTNKITNLTPRTIPRTTNGWYAVEARWDSTQQTLRQETMKPWVVVGTEFYPMQRVLLMTNRWESAVPVRPGQRFLNYRFKFEYSYKAFGPAQADSKSSPTYVLEIID